jgi:NAD(P)H-flavin reductase
MLYVPGVGKPQFRSADDLGLDSPYYGRAVGNVTKALARLTVGETLGLRGPFGSSWPMEQCLDQHVIVITGGIGLAPLRPALYHLMDQRGQFRSVSLLYGARTPSERLYPKEFAAWARNELAIEQTVDRCDSEWQGHVGVVTLLLERHNVADPANTQVLICGPEIMMQYAALGAIKKGIPAENIWVSLERNMNCAVGFCGHCQLGPAFICKDGPVLPTTESHHFLP